MLYVPPGKDTDSSNINTEPVVGFGPLGRMPSTMLTDKFEETAGVDEPYSYYDYARNCLIDRRPDPPLFEYEESADTTKQSRGRLNVLHYGSRSGADPPNHAEMFQGFLDSDNRDWTNQVPVARLAEAAAVRMRYLKPSDSGIGEVTGGEAAEPLKYKRHREMLVRTKKQLRTFGRTIVSDGRKIGRTDDIASKVELQILAARQMGADTDAEHVLASTRRSASRGCQRVPKSRFAGRSGVAADTPQVERGPGGGAVSGGAPSGDVPGAVALTAEDGEPGEQTQGRSNSAREGGPGSRADSSVVSVRGAGTRDAVRPCLTELGGAAPMTPEMKLAAAMKSAVVADSECGELTEVGAGQVRRGDGVRQLAAGWSVPRVDGRSQRDARIDNALAEVLHARHGAGQDSAALMPSGSWVAAGAESQDHELPAACAYLDSMLMYKCVSGRCAPEKAREQMVLDAAKGPLGGLSEVKTRIAKERALADRAIGRTRAARANGPGDIDKAESVPTRTEAKRGPISALPRGQSVNPVAAAAMGDRVALAPRQTPTYTNATRASVLANSAAVGAGAGAFFAAHVFDAAMGAFEGVRRCPGGRLGPQIVSRAAIGDSKAAAAPIERTSA